MAQPLPVAIVQQTAVYLDLEASMLRAEELITRCASNGAKLIVFGECWLTGYPAWIDHAVDYARWDDPMTKDLFGEMHTNSIAIPGPETDHLGQLARDLDVCICMGCNEIDRPSTGTIYNSFILLDAEGTIVTHHRKLMPTFTEKLLYGLGDGRGMHASDTRYGRIGALICWEHWMPLLRQAMHNSVEHVHIALWPQVHEMLRVASRHYAFEGRCFVIAAGQLMNARDLPDTLEIKDPSQPILNGGSCIIAPDGTYVLEPQYDGPEVIFYTIPDLDIVYGERMTLDTSGHYQRPDLFDFRVLDK